MGNVQNKINRSSRDHEMSWSVTSLPLEVIAEISTAGHRWQWGLQVSESRSCCRGARMSRECLGACIRADSVHLLDDVVATCCTAPQNEAAVQSALELSTL